MANRRSSWNIVNVYRCLRGPTLGEMLYTLHEITFEITEIVKSEINVIHT